LHLTAVDPMNIVILNDFGFVSGGAASVAISSAKGLAARGHRVIFLTAVGPIDPSLALSGVEVIDTGQQQIRADTTRFAAQWNMTWNGIAADVLLRRLSDLDHKRTIIHLHGWTKALSSSVAQAGASRNFKLVCTLHDYAVACPRGSFFDRASMDHCQRKPLSLACVASDCDGGGNLKLKLLRSLRHATQRTIGKIPARVDAFVVVSRFSRAIIEPYLPPHRLVCEIPNPIEVEHGEPVNVIRNRLFLMAGRLTVEKGALLLARAAHECNVPVLFAGDGPCRSDIMSANPAAKITGWLSRFEVQDHVRRARALVFPSLWYEMQGMVVPEAAALGVPAVVSDTSAAIESVRDGATGLHFKNGDLASLKTALVRLSDNTLVGRLATACYQAYWDAPPTLERHVASLEELYRAVLNRPPGDR
jgi:glycosyltransferase involved in cell wall biosynthesis